MPRAPLSPPPLWRVILARGSWRVISVLYNTFDFECEKSDCICFKKCAADVNSRSISCYKDEMLSTNVWDACLPFAFLWLFPGRVMYRFSWNHMWLPPRPPHPCRQLALNGRSLCFTATVGTCILGFGSKDCLHEPHTRSLAKSLRATPPSIKSAIFSQCAIALGCAAGN